MIDWLTKDTPGTKDAHYWLRPHVDDVSPSFAVLLLGAGFLYSVSANNDCGPMPKCCKFSKAAGPSLRPRQLRR